MNASISFELNGRPVRIETDPNRRLLWVLRADLGLTGAKYGCGNGACGACTVLVDGVAVRSCLATIDEVKDRKVITIEGLAQDGKLHPVQQAFLDQDALQCGFCTPGMILNAYSLLLANPSPTEADVIEGMDGNLCRCGAHPRIVRAVLAAAETMKGGAQ
jgi:aerobic-type carbon monoxide dehydrogenase small subunit (CoxS/CutS family)